MLFLVQDQVSNFIIHFLHSSFQICMLIWLTDTPPWRHQPTLLGLITAQEKTLPTEPGPISEQSPYILLIRLISEEILHSFRLQHGFLTKERFPIAFLSLTGMSCSNCCSTHNKNLEKPRTHLDNLPLQQHQQSNSPKASSQIRK